MNRDDFTAALKLAVLSVASRYHQVFTDEELAEYVGDLMHGYSPGRLALIPEALAQIRRGEDRDTKVMNWFPQVGEVRALVNRLPIPQQYLDAAYDRFTQKVLSQPAPKQLRSVNEHLEELSGAISDIEGRPLKLALMTDGTVKIVEQHELKQLSEADAEARLAELRKQADDLTKQ
jgi:hypothetical protein